MKTLQLDASIIESKKKAKVKPRANLSTHDQDKLKQSKSGKHKPGIIKKIKKWYLALTPFKKVLTTLFFCIIVIGLGGSTIYFTIIYRKNAPDFTLPEIVTANTTNATPSTYLSASIAIPFPNPPRDQQNPINGDLYTSREMKAIENRYPIAVMIENHIDARPQSGYNSADIIYEALVEGGITRTMAIFWGKECDEIGPIRSARQYFIEWLMPYDPLYMYIGYAISNDPRVNAGGSIYEYGIKGMDKYGTFWRSTSKWAPHNAYSSSELLYQKAEQFGYTGNPSTITPWKFKKDASADQRGTTTQVDITFFERLPNGGLYDIRWIYDRERNVYLKYNKDNPYLDANTDTQVYAKNVIIQRTETISTFNSKAHLIITTIGKGDAILLRDGHVINGTWTKKDLNSRTVFYDSTGKEVELNRGIIWIDIVPNDQGSVKI